MTQNVYSIYDNGTKAYFPPFFMSQDNEAVRMFDNLVNNEKGTNVYKYPQDYILFKIGSWDNEMGLLEAAPVNEKIIEGNAIKRKVENPDPDQTTIFEAIKRIEEQVSGILNR